MDDFIAHIRESDKAIQTVKEHLLGVKGLAEEIGAKIGVKHIAGLGGLLHDLGKYTEEFKKYLHNAVHNPGSPSKRGSVDHSTAGGKLLFDLYHQGKPDRYTWILAEIVGNAVFSHHSYLHDFLSPELESGYLNRALKEKGKGIEEYHSAVERFFQYVMDKDEFDRYVQKAVEELEAFLLKPFEGSDESKCQFLSKYVFSALIDADRTNTRLFEENKSVEPELDHGALFQDYYDKLMLKLDSLQSQSNNGSAIPALRKEMSERCEQFAELYPSGIYALSIPTGGGKTLASFRYALKHAIKDGKKRIIYVIPFTTIIEQNAQEIRNIVKDDEHVLEHHSNVVWKEEDDDEDEDGLMTIGQKLKLAKDNWDSPVIFTTMVQFLNVFYAKGSRNTRRLHNLSESVIVFDEVQKVPVSCVSLFNQALNFLKAYGHSSLLLCTATQPELSFVEYKLDIAPQAEIIEKLDQVIDAFKRVELVDRATGETFDTEKLAQFVEDKLEESGSVLVVLNTKAVVKRLYRQLSSLSIPVYHLSTSMCAAHRQTMLDLIRTHLDKDEKVVCISTQLIEAGVDVSFGCVVRSLAGLDSVAQAAGRCNRHGRWDIRQVYMIDHEEENLTHLKEIQVGKKLTAMMLLDLKRDGSCHGGHLLSVEAIQNYFRKYYSALKLNLNYHVRQYGTEMTKWLMGSRADNTYLEAYKQDSGKEVPLFLVQSYRTAAEQFQVIDSLAKPVIVPYGDKGADIIARLSGESGMKEMSQALREAQQYTINLFPHELNQLAGNNGLVSLLEGRVLALTEGAYNDEFGLDVENESEFGLKLY
ncbi:CRISPR-associated helicase Cas3' [Paenibacillus sp. GCM10027627]|uniref:CRISPR-associated helicase Cas3' n=1 Tax=unclassified Paenibacillus TaxID=185978 RepID=UPI003628230E